MNSQFEILILLGRPASGKSEVIDHLKKTPVEERLARFHIGAFEEIDDFPMLWTWFEEDAILEKLARLCAELLQSIRHAGTQILIKTPPGAAQYFASYLDQACLHGVLGTIAGDDTLLVIATDEEAAESTVGQISEMTRTGRPAEREQL